MNQIMSSTNSEASEGEGRREVSIVDFIQDKVMPGLLLAVIFGLLNLYVEVQVLKSEQKQIDKIEAALEKNTASLNEIKIMMAKITKD